MSMPFYVAPEQFMKDKADFARKNIARGRPLVAAVFDGGILICAENKSRSLHKVSEIYDRIAFAGVGRYNEFDSLRRARSSTRRCEGVPVQPGGRGREVPGQSVRAVHGKRVHPRAQATGGGDPRGRGRRYSCRDQLYHILYDGSVVDEDRFSVLGGEAEAIAARIDEGFRPDRSLEEALRLSAGALYGPDRPPVASDLEVAVLSRTVESSLPPSRRRRRGGSPRERRRRREPATTDGPAEIVSEPDDVATTGCADPKPDPQA